MPEVMKPAQEPQLVACSTASQAWNMAELRSPPVPLPPFLTHAASAAALATSIAPAKASAGSIVRTNLAMTFSLKSAKRQRAGARLPEIAAVAHSQDPHFGGRGKRFFRRRGRPVTGPPPSRGQCSCQLACQLQVDGLRTFAALVRLGLERDAHTLVERADIRALDGRDMHEHVLAPLIGCDEAEAFRLVEELYSSSLPHARSPISPGKTRGSRQAGIAD